MDVDQFEREYIHTSAAVLREIDNLADILASLDHSWFDDTAGSSGDPGPFTCNWYGVMSDKDTGFHAIVRQSNDGFNYCETFDTADQCADTWAKIQLDALEIARTPQASGAAPRRDAATTARTRSGLRSG